MPPMDPFLAAKRLPKLSERAMREAIVSVSLAREHGARVAGPRMLADEALVRFERFVRRAGRAIRPALLFAERDRILADLQTFAAQSLGLAAVRGSPARRCRRWRRRQSVRRDSAGASRRSLRRRVPPARQRRKAARHDARNSQRGSSLSGRRSARRAGVRFRAGTIRMLRCGASAVELVAA